ncbi:MAG: DUF4003 family protein, partial [Bacillota bacterium]|nr:DUF4003 family protein [Bacillota bacterium]
MEITMIHGQRHKGSTYHAARSLADKITLADTTVHEFFMPTNGPDFCVGCYGCILKGEEKCPHAAQVQPIIAAMCRSEVIILDSPTYCYEMTGQLKTLLDHFAYLWLSHRPRGEMFRKIGVVISTAAGAGAGVVTKSLARQMQKKNTWNMTDRNYWQDMKWLALKQYSFWKNDMAKRLAALLFAAEGQQVDIAAIRAAEAVVKQKTGLFSSFRGATDMAIYALLALTADPESYLDRILSAHLQLRQAGYRSSDYLAVASCLIARDTSQENLAEQCAMAGNWLKAMKQQHRFLVGQDDYVYAVMLASAGLDPQNDLDRIEQNYRDLRYDLRPRGSVYQLCQVLALSSKPDLYADRVRKLRDA